MKHFINLKDIPSKDLRKIITDAKKRKNSRKKLNTLDFKIRSLQGKAAAQVFGVVGGLIFLVGLAAYSGVLAKTEYIVGFSALTYIALSQYSPVNTAFSFLTVAYRTEFSIDDWIQVSNTAGSVKGKVKDFTMKGVRIKTFDMSEN